MRALIQEEVVTRASIPNPPTEQELAIRFGHFTRQMCENDNMIAPRIPIFFDNLPARIKILSLSYYIPLQYSWPQLFSFW